MTEQPPSASSLWTDLVEKDDRTSPEEYPDMALIKFEEFEYILDHYASQRVSAETDRWQHRDRQRLEQIGRLQETAQSFQSARAERPAPEAEVARLRMVLDTHSKMMHPWYGPCDGFGPEEQCAECLRVLGRDPFAERPASVHLTLREQGVMARALLRSTHPAPEGPNAVDTERVLQAARDAVESVPTEFWVDRRNIEAIAQAMAPDFAGFASAVASKRDAAAIRAFGGRVWSDGEEIAYQAGVSDTLARLREPDAREALRSAFMGVPNWQVRGAPTNVEVAGDLAEAAIARIAEMLK